MAPVVGHGILSSGRNLTEEEAEARFKGQVILVQIELPAYGANPALILRLATRRFEDKDGLPWWPRIKEPPSIDYGGGFLESRLHPAAADFSVLDDWIPGQPKGTTFADLLVLYEFDSARVWIRQAFTDLNLTSDYPTIFDGEITEWDDADDHEVPFHAVHKRAWNVLMPKRVLREEDFPNAPDAARGTALPLLWGDGRSRRYLTHPALPNTFEAANAGVARGALPALIIDAPTSAGLVLPKFLVSDRDIDGADPLDARWFMHEQNLDRLAGPGSAVLTNPAGGPATLALSSITQRVAILPIEWDTATPTPATGWQELLRETKPPTLAGVAQLDFDANKKIGRWKLPDVSPLGKFISCDVGIYYAKNAWTGTLGDAAIENTLSTQETRQAFVAGASVTYPSPNQFQQVQTFAVGAGVVAGWSDIKNCYLELVLNAAGQALQVHRMVLLVQYQAAAKTEVPGTQREGRSREVNVAGRRASRENTSVGRLYANTISVGSSSDLLSFDHPLYFYGRGKLDTTGSITGTSGALIEHPCDIVRDFLQAAGVPGGEITTATNTFGSFADAKSHLVTYKMLVHLTRQANADKFLQEMSDQSLCWFRRRGTQPTSPFVALPWDIGLTPNYRTGSDLFTFARTTPWMRQGSLRRFRTRVSDVVNRLRVDFDWDPRTNTYAQQVYITDTASRVYVAGFTNAYVADFTGRVATAAASVARHGAREDSISLPWVVDPVTATSVLWRLFDLIVSPRVGARFDTFVQAYDLEIGHRIRISDDWDSVTPFPRPGSNGSWGGKSLVVTSVKRPKDRPVIYEVEAVEITT